MLGILGFRCAGASRKPLIAFSAVGVDSRSSVFGDDSTQAAVAGPLDINAMMGGDDDDAAAAGAAALAAARAAASARHRHGSRSGLSSMLRCQRAVDWNETTYTRISA